LQSGLIQGDSGDDSDEEAEREERDIEDVGDTESSSDEGAQGYEEGTTALLDASGPSSPPETDVELDRPAVNSRHTSPDDVDQFPITPASMPEGMVANNLLQLEDTTGDEVLIKIQPPDPIKEPVASTSPPPEHPSESPELDYHEPDLVSARPSTPLMEDEVDEEGVEDDGIKHYLRPYAVTKVDGWDPEQFIKPSPILRGSLRPYQRAGLEWLANHHTQMFNCILADEMGMLLLFHNYQSTDAIL
jgi:helicase SWR1